MYRDVFVCVIVISPRLGFATNHSWLFYENHSFCAAHGPACVRACETASADGDGNNNAKNAENGNGEKTKRAKGWLVPPRVGAAGRRGRVARPRVLLLLCRSADRAGRASERPCRRGWWRKGSAARREGVDNSPGAVATVTTRPPGKISPPRPAARAICRADRGDAARD